VLHVIVTVYKRTENIKVLIESFLVQTNPNWQMYILHDGPAPEKLKSNIKRYCDEPRISFFELPKCKDKWGNGIRFLGLNMIVDGSDNSFILVTNDDNYYVPDFVDIVLKEAAKPKVGLIYYDFVHHYNYEVMKSRLKVNYIDMGAFIVNVRLAEKVKFYHIEEGGADGMFAEDCKRECERQGINTIYIPKVLFVHN